MPNVHTEQHNTRVVIDWGEVSCSLSIADATTLCATLSAVLEHCGAGAKGVKVIDTKPDQSVVKRIVCRHCGATLEYVPNDVRSYNGTDYGGGPDGQEWVDCPNCGKRAVIRSW